MHWILFSLAVGCFLIVLNSTSALLVGLTLLLGLALILAGVIAMASARIQGQARSEARILSADELRALRERGSPALGDRPAPLHSEPIANHIPTTEDH